MAEPRVSVLLPFRNAASTLDAALQSILAERDVPFELLAVNDGSKDDWQVSEGLRDPRVRVLDGAGRGLVAALELARTEARAPYLLRMDADDVMVPGRMAAQVAALEASDTLGVVGSLTMAVGGGQGLQLYVQWQNSLRSPADHRRELFIESPLCHPSTMLRARAIEAIGGYRHGDFPEDYDLWLRLWKAGWEMSKVPIVGVQWRHGPGRATFVDPRYRPEAFLKLKVGFLATRLADEKRSLVVWGAGKSGRKLMRELEPYGYRVGSWIDIDPDKIGREIRGGRVCSPASLDRDKHFVLGCVASRGARGLIRDALKRQGFIEDEDMLFVA